jgi:hypothetical protein
MPWLLCLLLLAAQRAAPSPAPAPATIVARSRAVAPGELIVLTIDTVEPAGAVRLRAFDRDVMAVRLAPRAWRALIGIDLDVAPGRHDVTADIDLPGGAARVTHRLDVKARVFPRRVLTVDEAFVNPPASAMDRIQADAQALAALWSAPPGPPLWQGAFLAPVPQPSNSAFGTRSVYNGQPRSAHGGADFLSPAGTPVTAPNAGRVVLARDLYYTGQTVVIDHGLGMFSLFAHLSAIDVTSGSMVTTGQRLGLVGATGRVTGPHLHWAVRIGGARVDPLAVLAMLGS